VCVVTVRRTCCSCARAADDAWLAWLACNCACSICSCWICMAMVLLAEAAGVAAAPTGFTNRAVLASSMRRACVPIIIPFICRRRWVPSAAYGGTV
jgi:hypothetical protein